MRQVKLRIVGRRPGESLGPDEERQFLQALTQRMPGCNPTPISAYAPLRSELNRPRGAPGDVAPPVVRGTFVTLEVTDETILKDCVRKANDCLLDIGREDLSAHPTEE